MIRKNVKMYIKIREQCLSLWKYLKEMGFKFFVRFFCTQFRFLGNKMYVLDQDYNDDFHRPRVVIYHLSFYGFVVRKNCAKNLTTIHHGIQFFLRLHPFTNTNCAKNMDIFSSRLTSNSVKMQQMCYRSFIESFWTWIM